VWGVGCGGWGLGAWAPPPNPQSPIPNPQSPYQTLIITNKNKHFYTNTNK
jgi:hypothetical protein